MAVQKNSPEKPLFNSRIINSYVKLVRKQYPSINITEILDHAGMELYEVADQSHWFTQNQMDRFHERLSRVTDAGRIAREAGRYAAEPDALGAMRQYILGLVGPGRVFSMIGQVFSNLTWASIFTSRRLASNRVEVTVEPASGAEDRPVLCENRMGFFEAMVWLFGRKNPRVEHAECLHRGGSVCRYVVSWENTFSDRLRAIRTVLTVPMAVISGIFLLMTPVLALQTFVPVCAALLLGLTMAIDRTEREALERGLGHLRESTVQLLDRMNANYNNALITNDIGRVISRETKIDDILGSVVQVLHDRLDYDRGLILLADEEKKQLCFKAGFGYGESVLAHLEKTTFRLDHPDSQGVFVVSFRKKKPFLINDINEIQGNLSSRSLDFARRMGVQSFISCPIICDGESVGILAVDNMHSHRPILQSDLNLLMGIAPLIGISIRNADLLDTSHRQFGAILKVLAASIDARDPLTAGHSDKVTEYSLGICVELKLPGEFIEAVRVAALLHDYGKIAVPDAILKKEGRLTHEEYEIVMTHTAKTREILEQVGFTGIYSDVPLIAACHHEKIDGSGYPYGMKGEEIPLGARIVCVADFFEAITSKRHYRNPMTLNEAFDLLREGSGTSFDPRVVEAMIRYYLRVYVGVTEHEEGVPVPRKRREVRVPCEAHVACHGDGLAVFGLGKNLSEGGIYVATDPSEMEVGRPVEVAFSLPSGVIEKTVKAAGRVAWVNSRCDRKKPILPLGFGVEFQRVNPMEVIHGFVQSRVPLMV